MSSLPRVTVVCSNLASNCLGRAMLLAQLLVSETPVRLVGFCRGQEVWRPAANLPFPVESYALPPSARYSPKAISWLKRQLGSDLVIVSKPTLHSFGFSLAAGIPLGRMIVDIDDWETGFSQKGANEPSTRLRLALNRGRSYGHRLGLNTFVATRALEGMAKRSPFHLVSNRWLQSKFGGRVLYHVRDPQQLDPARATPPPGIALSRQRPWVGFVGTPRKHKGLFCLVDAMASLDGPNAPGLFIMGADASAAPALEQAKNRLGERFRSVEQFPFEQLGDYLSLIDIIAIPSLDVPSAWGQIPAKLFDALAMAKPVVVSDINDMAELADGCGITVPPGDATALAEAIAKLGRDPELRQSLGAAGRNKFLSRFTYSAGRQVLLDVIAEATQ